MIRASLVHLPFDDLGAALAAGGLLTAYGIHLWHRHRSSALARLDFLAELTWPARLFAILVPLGLVGAMIVIEEPREFLRTALCLIFSALALLWGRLAGRGLVPVLAWGPMSELAPLPRLPLGFMAIVAMLVAAPLAFLALALSLVGLLRSEKIIHLRRTSGTTLFCALFLALGFCVPPLRAWGAFLGSFLFLLGLGWELWSLRVLRRARTAGSTDSPPNHWVIVPVRAAREPARRRWEGVKRLLRVP